MTWDSILIGLLLMVCICGGMILGAWIAARGFEKSMTSVMDDPDAPWNKDDEDDHHKESAEKTHKRD